MRMRALALGALAAAALPAAASAADPSGAWIVKAEFGPQLKYTLMCVLKPGEKDLSGPCFPVQGRVLRTLGRRSGANLRFSYETDYNGNGLHLDYNGTVGTGGVAKGTVGAGTSSGVFEAAPLPEFSTDLTTVWKVDVEFNERLKYVVLCAFQAEGARLRGPCAIVQGATLSARGAADGSGFSLAYDTAVNGRPVHLDYAGTAQPDGSVKGKVTTGESVGIFTAARP